MQHQQAQKIIRVSNAVAAGTTNINCTSVDMSNWESVEFFALLGTLTATQVTKLKAQDSSDNSSFSDLESSATSAFADNASNLMGRLEVVKPRNRYVRAVVLRGTANAVVDGVIAVLRNAHNQPITQDASVPVYKSLVSPAQGTA